MGSFVIASITFTISITSIFKPFRELISKAHVKVEELIHCPWCMSFWALLILLLSWSVPNMQVTNSEVFNLLFTLFAMYTPVGLIHYVLLRAYKPVIKLMAMRNIEKVKRQLNG